MVEPGAGEAGEGVNDTNDMIIIVQHDEGVNRIVVHRFAGIHNLGVLPLIFRKRKLKKI